MSSLALQLKQATKAVLPQRTFLSFLFDAAQATDLDLETVYSIGVNGLTELTGMDPRFADFEKSLLSESMKSMDRTLETKEVNDRLDADIHLLLQMLCPYFQLKPAHKVIEWLVRRFRIHEFNINSIMVCILPYHETNLFVRMIQLCSFNNFEEWKFLMNVQTKRAQLPREKLVALCAGNAKIRKFVLDMVPKAIEADTLSKTLVSFYTSTIIDLFRNHARQLAQGLHTIVSYLLTGLASSKHPEYQLGTFMIVSQLAMHLPLSLELVDTFITTISKHAQEAIRKEALMTILCLCQTQRIENFSQDTFNAILKAGKVHEHLVALNKVYDVAPLLLPLVKKLSNLSTPEEGFRLLSQILRGPLKLKDQMVRDAIEVLLADLLRSGSPAEEKRAKDVLLLFQPKHSELLGDAIQKALQGSAGKEAAKDGEKLYAFLTSTFAGTRHEPIGEAGTTLYLGTIHADPRVRLLSVKKLRQALASGKMEASLVSDMIMARILDESFEVQAAVLDIPGLFDHVSNQEELVQALISQLHNRKAPSSVACKIIDALCVSYLEANPDEVEKIVGAVTPLLYTLGERSKKRAKKLLEVAKASEALSRHPLLAGIDQAVGDEEWETLTEEQLNSRLMGKLSDNILKKPAQMDNLVAVMELFPVPNMDYKTMLVILLLLLLSKSTTTDLQLRFAETIMGLLQNERKFKSVNPPTEGFTRETFSLEHSDVLGVLKSSKKDKEKSHLRQDLVHVALLSIIRMVKAPEGFSFRLGKGSSKDQTGQKYFNLMKSLFLRIARSPMNTPTSNLLQELFHAHLKDSPLPFLANFWSNGEMTEVLPQVTSLYLCHSYLESLLQTDNKKDLQVFVPILLSTLNSDSPAVKLAGLSCLKSMYRLFLSFPLDGKKATLEIVDYKALYGKDKGALLSNVEVLNFLAMVTKFEDQMNLDVAFLRKQLAEYFQFRKNRQTNKEVLLFLLNAVNHASGQVAFQVNLLSLLQLVDSPLKLKSLHELMGRLSKASEQSFSEDPATVELLDLTLKSITQTTAGHMEPEEEKSAFTTFCAALDTTTLVGAEQSVQSLALNRINKQTFAFFLFPAQKILLSRICKLALSGSQFVSRQAKATVADIPIKSSLFIHELAAIQKNLKASQPDPSAAPGKRRRIAAAQETASRNLLNSSVIEQLVVLLEMIEIKEQMEDAYKLIPVLFDVLSEILNANSDASLEYVKQLLLSALLNVLGFALSQGVQTDERDFRVDLIVQCIRVSENPQTHNNALLLMGAIASVNPDPVLSNIMPVFTFMGANVLRQDDNYSFQVIQQTLEKVIPPLVAFQKKNAAEVFTVADVKPVIKVFVDALLHIPKHRRLRLFTVLVSTLGDAQFLSAVIALILEKNIVLNPNVNPEKDKNDPESMSAFAISLTNQFSSEVVAQCLVQLMTMLNQLPNEKPAAITEKEVKEALFSIQEHSSKQFRQFKMAGLVFVGEVLSNKVFLQKLLTSNAEQQKMEGLYLTLLEQVLLFINSATAEQSKHGEEDSTINKLWKFLSKLGYEALDRINNLLQIPSLIRAITSLATHSHALVRRKALTMLNEKITSLHSQEHALHAPLFMGTLSLLKNTIKNDESPVNKQTGLLSIEMLAKAFGKNNFSPFLETIPAVLEVAEKSKNLQVIASSMICLGTLCGELGHHALSAVPKVVPILTANFDKYTPKNVAENERKSLVLLQLSIISALHEIVSKLPQFLNPYLRDILRCTLHPSFPVSPQPGLPPQELQLHKKVKILQKLIARNVVPRLLFPAIFDVFKTSTSKNTLTSLFSMLGSVFGNMNRDSIVQHHGDLFRFYLDKGFSAPPTEDREDVENHIIGSFMQLAMKLNEKLFRPMLLQALQWAAADDGHRPFFSHLIFNFADQLKSIFVPFYGHLLDDTIALLRKLSDQFDPKMSPAPLALSRPESSKVWQYTVDGLFKTLQFDAEGFFDKEKLSQLISPLVDQLDGSLRLLPSYEGMVTDHLAPCLGQLAVCCPEEQLKTLNHQVLMKTRSEDVKVRMMALKVQSEFYRRLGEQMLPILPETIPFLAELLEDEEEGAEKLCRELIKTIEVHLGEPLQKYFK